MELPTSHHLRIRKVDPEQRVHLKDWYAMPIKQNLMLLILLQLQVQLLKLLIRCHWQLDQVGLCFVLDIRSVVTC